MYLIVTEFHYSLPLIHIRSTLKKAMPHYSKMIAQAKSAPNQGKRVSFYIVRDKEFGVPEPLCNSGDITHAN